MAALVQNKAGEAQSICQQLASAGALIDFGEDERVLCAKKGLATLGPAWVQDRRTDKGPSVSVDAEPAEIDIETDTERQRQTAKDKQAERERPVRARKMAGRLSGSAVSASSER